MYFCRVDLVSRTNVHFLVFHLTLADAVISFITMPMETIWRVVIEVVIVLMMVVMMVLVVMVVIMMLQWHAGNVACKVLMMIRTGGYILSSLMLIVLSIDRLTTTLLRYITLLSSKTSSLPSHLAAGTSASAILFLH